MNFPYRHRQARWPYRRCRVECRCRALRKKAGEGEQRRIKDSGKRIALSQRLEDHPSICYMYGQTHNMMDDNMISHIYLTCHNMPAIETSTGTRRNALGDSLLDLRTPSFVLYAAPILYIYITYIYYIHIMYNNLSARASYPC